MKKIIIFCSIILLGACGVSTNKKNDNVGSIDKEGYIKNIPELQNCRMYYLIDYDGKKYQILKCNNTTETKTRVEKKERNNISIN